MTANQPARSLVVVCVAAAVLLAGGVAGFGAATPVQHGQAAATDDPVAVQGNETNQTNQTNETGNVTDATANVTFVNQTSNGTVVVVQNVSLSEGGFVNVHDESLFENETVGSVVGVSAFLEPGVHRNVTVELYNVTGANFTNDSLPAGNHTLVAMAHLDTNDNQSFDFVATNGSEDVPYTFANGSAVTDPATVQVTDGNATDATANATADNVTANETNVTVNETNATNSSVAVEQ